MADDTPEAVLTEEGKYVPPEVPSPTTETVWFRHLGVAHHVHIGSEAHKRLTADGARPIDGPTDADLETTDFGMIEKAKADKTSRR